MSEIIFFSFAIIIFFTIKICERKKILLDFKKEKHKRFASKINNYSIGGIIFFSFCLFTFFEKKYFDTSFLIFLSLIFFLGF